MTTAQKVALSTVMSIDKDVMHGTPCFTGTRIPVQTLIDFLETGESVDDFLQIYPYVQRTQIQTFLSMDLTVG